MLYESYIHVILQLKAYKGNLGEFQKNKRYDETKQLYIDNGLSEKRAETVIREKLCGAS